MTYRVAVGLGSNLEPRLENLRRAVTALGDLGKVEAVSSLYETAPVGGPEQGSYLNAVVVLSTDREPEDLLGELLRIEEEAGRERGERWGPRSLDLDVITALAEDGRWVQLRTPTLEVPHPRAHLRRFVLVPLVEVWPDARLAGDLPAIDRLAEVEDQEVERLGGGWATRRPRAARSLLGGQALLLATYGAIVMWTGRSPRRADSVVVAGAITTVGGMALTTWGAASLGPALSPYPEPRPGTGLVLGGPYRWVRHPIYAGLVLSLVGGAGLVRSWPALIGSAVIGTFFSFKARYEESRLRLAVPGYAAYQRRVRGRLIPRTNGPT